MSLERDITLIKTIPLFSCLPTDQLAMVAFSATRQELAAGEVLFREGDDAASGLAVLSGAVQLIGGTWTRRAPILCGVGSLIGELALFVDGKRAASAVAVVPSAVLEIPRNTIVRLLTEYPETAQRLHELVADGLSAILAELVAWSSAPASAIDRKRAAAA